ncbi:MAG: hypothetical protein ACLPTZ_07205, partial [Beijerinckiaceae bacterium]
MDRRVALHEAGHVLVGRALGGEIGGATITSTEFFAGRVWGPNGNPSHLGSGFDVCTEARPYLPRLGESRSDAAELFTHAIGRCIELAAGTASEKLFFPDDEPLTATDDQRQSSAFAGLVCCTPAAVGAFLAYAASEAAALLNEHRGVVIQVADALLERRTLNGAEIDQIIADALAREDLAAERSRRAAWAKTLLSAAEPAIDLLVVMRRSTSSKSRQPET